MRPESKGRHRRTGREKWLAAQEQMLERNREALEKRTATNAAIRDGILRKAGEEDLLGPRFRNGND